MARGFVQIFNIAFLNFRQPQIFQRGIGFSRRISSLFRRAFNFIRRGFWDFHGKQKFFRRGKNNFRLGHAFAGTEKGTSVAKKCFSVAENIKSVLEKCFSIMDLINSVTDCGRKFAKNGRAALLRSPNQSRRRGSTALPYAGTSDARKFFATGLGV